MPLNRKPIVTADGSHSLYVPSLDETYHSQHGAITESRHVFIQNGLNRVPPSDETLHIIEIGFGTGLNAWLTWLWAHNHQQKIRYTTLEKFPLSPAEYSVLNYANLSGVPQLASQFLQLHTCEWGIDVEIDKLFVINKQQADFNQYTYQAPCNVVFFDAFSADKQPDLWTVELFSKLFKVMQPQGIFTTYSAKGQVRRNLQTVGFEVERVPGPPGKREMLVARKPL